MSSFFLWARKWLKKGGGEVASCSHVGWKCYCAKVTTRKEDLTRFVIPAVCWSFCWHAVRRWSTECFWVCLWSNVNRIWTDFAFMLRVFDFQLFLKLKTLQKMWSVNKLFHVFVSIFLKCSVGAGQLWKHTSCLFSSSLLFLLCSFHFLLFHVLTPFLFSFRNTLNVSVQSTMRLIFPVFLFEIP